MGKGLEGSGRGLIQAVEGGDESNKKYSDTIAGVAAETRSGHFRNMRLVGNCCNDGKALGVSVMR
jgi:hypothetical protein